VNGAKIFEAQNFGTWKVIYQREGEIGGVVDAADADPARAFVEKYLAGQIN
jgi:predicted secreted protein